MSNIDDCEFRYEIEKQIRETEEEFIYTTIYPFCETIIEKKVSKKELEKILRKGMQKSIPLDGVKQAIKEICRISPVDSTIGDNIPVFKNCDDIKLEVVAILNKLIEESEEVNE